MAEQIEIKGLRELDKRLKQFPQRIQNRILRGAFAAGARVIQREAKARAPIADRATPKAFRGQLRANIVVRSKRSPKGAIAYVTLRQKGKAGNPDNAYYGRFVEFGTSKMAAQPFMRPAFEAKHREALDRIKRQLARGIEREARRR